MSFSLKDNREILGHGILGTVKEKLGEMEAMKTRNKV